MTDLVRCGVGVAVKQFLAADENEAARRTLRVSTSKSSAY